MVDATQDPEREVRAALALDDRTRRLATAQLEPLQGGLSNHAWRADDGGESFFVRLSPHDAERLGVDRGSERALLLAVAAAGLAPDVVHCEPAQRLLVTRFVTGRTWTRDEAIRPQNLRRLAECVRRLHALPIAAGVQTVDFSAQAAALEAQVRPASSTRELQARARDVFAALRQTPVAGRLCHNDLHHLNLLDDGRRLWLVDWEYGGVGDPYFDLAAFLCQHDSTQATRDALLETLGDARDDAPRRLQRTCWAFDYVQWLWYRAWLATDAHADRTYAERAALLQERLAASIP